MQLVVIESPGAELWFIVKHARGSFKLRSDSPIGDAFTGAIEGWTGTHVRSAAPSSVRITTAEWRRLKALEDSSIAPLD